MVLLHLFVAPYTKVEESFNIQALHDILIHGIPSPFDGEADDFLAYYYDHVFFPGSVPRTFVGAAFLSGLARPFAALLSSPAELQVLGELVVHTQIPDVNLTHVSQSHTRPDQRTGFVPFPGRSRHSVWQDGRTMVYRIPSVSISCHVLCIKDTTEHVRFRIE